MISLLASLVGIVGTVLLLGQLLLSNRFVVSRFSEDLIKYNSLHQRLGRTGVLLILLHPILVTLSYSEPLYYIFFPTDVSIFSYYVSFGRIAFIFLLVILITSIQLRQILPYRTWHYLHLLAYPTIGLGLWHAVNVGSRLATYQFLKSFWYGLIIVYVLITVIRFFTWAGFGKRKYFLKSKSQLSAEVYTYRFKSFDVGVKPKPGQFIYMQLRRFGESHPFTVVDFDSKTGNLEFAVKVVGPFSRSLTELKVGRKIFIDGPYGVFTKESRYHKPNVFIAGGIGITPFVKSIESDKDGSYLFYSNRYFEKAIYRNKLKEQLGQKYVDIESSRQRLDSGIIKARLPDKVWEKAKYYICGPVEMINTIKTGLLALGISQKNIYSEKFSL